MKITVTTNNPKHQQLATFLREMFVDVSYKHPGPSWEKWFAWYPVEVDGHYVWLEMVERKLEWVDPINGFEWNTYREVGNVTRRALQNCYARTGIS